MIGVSFTSLPLLVGCSDAAPSDGREHSSGMSIDDNVIVRALSANSGLSLDVVGLSTEDGAEIQQWDYWKALNQRWRLRNVGGDDYEIRSVNSDKCLDVEGVSKDPGARVHQWSCWGGPNQKWKLRHDDDGAWEIISANSGLCLDVIGISKDPGARVQQWPCWGSANQKWQLDRLDDGGNPTGALDPKGGGTSGGGTSGGGGNPPPGKFGNSALHAEKLGLYMIPDINGGWTAGGGGGACPWPGTQATLAKMHELLPNAWIRWDNETGHGPDTPGNVEAFVSCANQAGIPMIIAADAVDGYNNWWALGGRQPPWSIVDIANGPYLRHAYDVAKKYGNVKLVETLNEPDGEWFVSDPDNQGDFDDYMSKLYEATGNDFGKIVGPAAAFRNNIWNDYLGRSELRNVSYHTYGGWSSLADYAGKDVYVTEYGGFDMNPRALLADLWQAERSGKLSGGIQKIFYVNVQDAFAEDTNENGHFAVKGWARSLAAVQALASISSSAYLDDGAGDFIATDDGAGQFGALLWGTGTRSVPNVSLGGGAALYVLRVGDAKVNAAQCAPIAQQSWVSVSVDGNTARINVNSLDANGAVLVTTRPCDALAN